MNQGVFVKHLIRLGCQRDIARIVSEKFYPPIWKWFVYKWAQYPHPESPKMFIKKYFPTEYLQCFFIIKLAQHDLIHIMKWAYSNGCHIFEWAALNVKPQTECGKWAKQIITEQRRQNTFVPNDLPQYVPPVKRLTKKQMRRRQNMYFL